MNKRARQRNTILNHLEISGHIDSVTAEKFYGITKLRPLVCELRKRGYSIEKRDAYFLATTR